MYDYVLAQVKRDYPQLTTLYENSDNAGYSFVKNARFIITTRV